jgi:hypothetical protein
LQNGQQVHFPKPFTRYPQLPISTPQPPGNLLLVDC